MKNAAVRTLEVASEVAHKVAHLVEVGTAPITDFANSVAGEVTVVF